MAAPLLPWGRVKYLSRRRSKIRRRGRPLALVVFAALVLGAWLLLARAWATCGFAGCPEVDRLGAFQPGGAPLLVDRHGEPFADLAPARSEVVALHALPSRVPQAFLAVEDRRFYEHDGVDWRRVAGALLANVRSRAWEEGGSTITMQLARSLFPEEIPRAERTAGRKLLEIRVAKEIEAEFSKPEILELYLNHIYLGNGTRGVEAAARHYFGRPAEELTLAQAALLAALPKAPSHYDPRRRPQAARARRDLVLSLMAEQGRVPEAEAEVARREPLGVGPAPRRAERAGPADHFVEEVRRRLEERFGGALYGRPVRVWTTLDLAAQRAAREELERQLRAIESGALGRFAAPRYDPAAPPPRGERTPYLQGAVLVMRVVDGDVLAWVGGRDFRHSQFDRVAGARRQAGSAFKPFVFAAALAEGWALSQPLADAPLAVRLASGRVWRPKNFGERYAGKVSLREALVRSNNVATVRLARQVGYGDVAALARRLGIERPIPENPAMPLGTLAVSPLELTAAYSAFAGLGRRVEPRLVLRVETADGELLWRPRRERTEALAPGVAYLLNHVLAEALERGSGAPVRAAGYRGLAAGKTGTSNRGVDAWFVGYDPELLAGVWLGFDRPAPIALRATGGRLAAPVWARIMARLAPRRRVPLRWARPPGVVARPIDHATGLVLEPGCRPHSGEPGHELFLAGAVPDTACPSRDRPPRVAAAEKRPVGEPRRDEEAERREREEEAAAREERKAREAQAARAAAAREREERRERETAATEEREELTAEEEAAMRARAAEERRRIARELATREREEEDDHSPLTGWWELTNRIESSSYEPYEGLRLGYRIHLEQRGDRLSGEGEKWSEDGRRLPRAQRTPIVLSGRIEGDEAIVSFTEHGARRTTSGTFTWRLADGGRAFSGTFSSGAAATRGSSRGRRLP